MAIAKAGEEAGDAAVSRILAAGCPPKGRGIAKESEIDLYAASTGSCDPWRRRRLHEQNHCSVRRCRGLDIVGGGMCQRGPDRTSPCEGGGEAGSALPGSCVDRWTLGLQGRKLGLAARLLGKETLPRCRVGTGTLEGNAGGMEMGAGALEAVVARGRQRCKRSAADKATGTD